MLLDSSANIAFKKRHSEVIKTLPQAEEIWISPIVLARIIMTVRREIAEPRCETSAWSCKDPIRTRAVMVRGASPLAEGSS